MASPLRIGVIGCGLQGHALIDSINHIEAPFRPTLAALCDPWPLARKSALGLIREAAGRKAAEIGTEEFATVSDEFCDKVNAVLIASPDYLHEEQEFMLTDPTKALYVPPMWWRVIDEYSGGAVCMVMASLAYDESDYIRQPDEFFMG